MLTWIRKFSRKCEASYRHNKKEIDEYHQLVPEPIMRLLGFLVSAVAIFLLIRLWWHGFDETLGIFQFLIAFGYAGGAFLNLIVANSKGKSVRYQYIVQSAGQAMFFTAAYFNGLVPKGTRFAAMFMIAVLIAFLVSYAFEERKQ